jgi:hypothetical protein
MPRRVLRYQEDEREMMEEVDRRTNVLRLLCPHTFCHVAEPLPLDKIEVVMGRLTSEGNYDRRTGDWASCQPYPLVREGDLRVDVMGYVNLTRPRLKIKVHTTNKKDGLEDKLDYEALFAHNEFIGIVHYDVKKPYTLDCREIPDDGRPYPNKSLDMKGMEMSRNPDNKAIILNLGDGKRRTYDDEIGRGFVAGTFDFWRQNPEVVGGYVAKQLIYAAQQDPRVKEIQEKALKAA